MGTGVTLSHYGYCGYKCDVVPLQVPWLQVCRCLNTSTVVSVGTFVATGTVVTSVTLSHYRYCGYTCDVVSLQVMWLQV